ncbi:MAG: hypothetical protein V4719_18185, partial [Planctomycetota bacterium]
AFCAAIIGAASTGWERGGFLWAVLYGLAAIILAPLVLTLGKLAFLALYPVLAIPGSFVATRLGWTSFSPYSHRRLWLQRLSVLLILIPLSIFVQRNAWSIFSLLASVALFGVAVLCLLVIVVVFILMRKVSVVASQEMPTSDPDTSFRWIKPDPPRLPPPSEE